MLTSRLGFALLSCAALTIAGCESSSDCIAEYGGDDLDAEAIDRLASEGLEACFSNPDADLSSEPLAVGTDARNGLTLEVFYTCSDVCPEAGWMGVRYRGVEEAGCCAVGGRPGFDPAWGGYLGCAPPEETFADANACDPPSGG